MRPFKLVLWTLFILWIISILGRFNNNFNILFSPAEKQDLKSVVENSLKGSSGRYGVFIKSLKTGESYYLNENKQFEAGSLYKLWVMVKVFEEIKKGKLTEDKIIKASISELNRKFSIASDEAELREGELEFSISSALEQMITISHNYAALMLNLEVGNQTIKEFTTASEMGEFFEKLYKGEVVDQESSKKMLEILRRQKINDRIPKLLPKEVKVAHKTADIGFFEHDGGIVYYEKGDYIIVVLSETDLPAAAGERIAELSKTVYDYFNTKR